MGGVARAADEIHPLLPHDTLTFLELNPAAARTGDQSALLDLGVQAMESIGVLSRKASEVGDMLTLIGMAGNHHSCLALLDADLSATPQGDLECNSVQVAWVIDTAGHPQEMVDRLTHMLSHLSTRGRAQQSVRKTAEAKREYIHFHDASWPAWLCLEWTQQGRYFVLTIGEGAMEHYLADRPVGGTPWEAMVGEVDTAAATQGSTGDIMARIYVAAGAFRERFPQPMQHTVLGRLFSTLDLTSTEAALFSTRIHDRAISMDNGSITNGVTTDTPWTVPLTNPALLKLIPPEATAYLAVKIDWPALYSRVLVLLDAIVPSGRLTVSQMLAHEEARHHVSLERDVIPYLQPIVIIHDAPQHPLRLPLMVTIVGAAQPEHADDVRKAIATMIGSAAPVLDRRASSHGPEQFDAPNLTHLRVRTDQDDVTYLQFGLVGPAWTWVQNRFVFSWSPAAVHYNIPAVAAAGGDAFSQPGK